MTTDFFDSLNQALQRMAPAVTLAASAPAFPPTMQPARQPPPSLSLESLGVAMLMVQANAVFDSTIHVPHTTIRA